MGLPLPRPGGHRGRPRVRPPASSTRPPNRPRRPHGNSPRAPLGEAWLAGATRFGVGAVPIEFQRLRVARQCFGGAPFRCGVDPIRHADTVFPRYPGPAPHSPPSPAVSNRFVCHGRTYEEQSRRIILQVHPIRTNASSRRRSGRSRPHVMLNLFQHPGSNASRAETWTLKQVQGDERGRFAPSQRAWPPRPKKGDSASDCPPLGAVGPDQPAISRAPKLVQQGVELGDGRGGVGGVRDRGAPGPTTLVPSTSRLPPARMSTPASVIRTRSVGPWSPSRR